MELDDLKQAIRNLERRMETQNKLNLQVQKERMLDRTHASLRPLLWGHIGQVGLGLLLAVLFGPVWVYNYDKPHLLIAGVAIHAYAVLMIVLGARMLWLLYSLDFAEPVLSIQKQLERVRRSYINSGLVVGLPWWVLWIPFAMLFLQMPGFDLYARANWAWLVWSAAIGVAGILLTLWFCRWSSSSFGQRVQASLAGNSLRSAQSFLDDIKQFEKE